MVPDDGLFQHYDYWRWEAVLSWYVGVREKAKCRVAMGGLISIDGLPSAFEMPIKQVMWRRAW